MTDPEPRLRHGLGRRPSRLGNYLVTKKLEDARRMSSEERLLVALDLSDICLELQRACSAKP